MYASVQDMIDRFGETEILRLSRPEDRATDVIDPARVATALADASSLIDTYLRGKYRLPVEGAAPAALVRAACLLARHDLAQTARSEPTEQMAKDHKAIMAWLEKVADNRVQLDLPRAGDATTTGGPGARFSDRPPAFSDRLLKGW